MYLECKFSDGETKVWQEAEVGGIDGLVKVYTELMSNYNGNERVMISRKFISSNSVCLPIAYDGFCIKSRDGSVVKKEYKRLKNALSYMKREETGIVDYSNIAHKGYIIYH